MRHTEHIVKQQIEKSKLDFEHKNEFPKTNG